jgi:hypothetical protein
MAGDDLGRIRSGAERALAITLVEIAVLERSDTSGYGEDELSRAGAFRVYRDPADLHRSLDELGIVP